MKRLPGEMRYVARKRKTAAVSDECNFLEPLLRHGSRGGEPGAAGLLAAAPPVIACLGLVVVPIQVLDSRHRLALQLLTLLRCFLRCHVRSSYYVSTPDLDPRLVHPTGGPPTFSGRIGVAFTGILGFGPAVDLFSPASQPTLPFSPACP